jgi:hypothetical protein
MPSMPGARLEGRNHARARRRVRHAQEDRIEIQQRIARKVHLRDQALHRRVAQEREVDVLRVATRRRGCARGKRPA